MSGNPIHVLVRQLRTLTAGRPVEGQTDQFLVEQFVARHDETAFASLLERHAPMVLGVCRRVLRDEHLREDVFQATFLVLASKASSIQKQQAVGSWLHGVAFRLARKAQAEAARSGKPDTRSLCLSATDPQAEISWRETCAILDDELQRLPTQYQLPLVLCYLEGRTRDEVAQELGWTVDRVRGLLQRGRDRLRSRLIRRGVTFSMAATATLLADTAPAATVPALLVGATLQSAVRLTSGHPLAACGISEPLLALLKTELSGPGFKKVAGFLVVLLTAGVLATSAALLAQPNPPEPTGNLPTLLPVAKPPDNRDEAGQKPADKDTEIARINHKKLQGIWRLTRTEINGKVVAEEDSSGKCTFMGDRIDLQPRIQAIQDDQQPGSSGLDDVERVTGFFQLSGPQANRLTITGTWLTSRGQKKETFHALYEVVGDTLKILLPLPGKQPPVEFQTRPDSGLQLFMFRRQPADQTRLLGDWILLQTEQDGNIVADKNSSGYCSFWDDRILLAPRIRLEKTKEGIRQEQLEDLFGTYELDTTKNPRRLTIRGQWTIDGNGQEGSPFQFLYEVGGDTLKLLVPLPGKQLPADFKTLAGTGHRLLTFRRQPPDKNAKVPAASAPKEAPPKLLPPDKVKAPAGWRLRTVIAPPKETRLEGPGHTAFSPDGQLLLCGQRLLDLATGQDVTFHKARWWPAYMLQFLGFATDGSAWGMRGKEFSQADSGRPTRWMMADWVTGRERSSFNVQEVGSRIALSPNGKTFASALGGTVRLWDAATGKSLGQFSERLPGEITQIVFSPDGRTLATASSTRDQGNAYVAGEKTTGTITLWEVATHQKRAARTEAAVFWKTMAFTPDSKRLVFTPLRPGSLMETGVRFWDAFTLKDQATLTLTNLGVFKDVCAGSLSDFAIAPDGKTVALTWSISLVKGRKFLPPPVVLAEVATGKVVALFEPKHAECVGAVIEDPNSFNSRIPASVYFANLAFSPDGMLLAIVDGQGMIRLWDSKK